MDEIIITLPQHGLLGVDIHLFTDFDETGLFIKVSTGKGFYLHRTVFDPAENALTWARVIVAAKATGG